MLIAVSGLKGVGKNLSSEMLQYCLSVPKWFRTYTCYRLFRNCVPWKYSITSFASILKESLAILLDISVEDFEDREFKENYYIYFPTLEITNNPPKNKILTDKQFSRKLAFGFDFIKEYYLSIRQTLQIYGTEVIKSAFGEKFWVLRTLNTEEDNLIISDLRFKSEFESVKDRRGAIIYINRNVTPGTHPSEREVIDLYKNNQFDYVVDNLGSKKDLFKQIVNISNKIG